MRVCLIIFLSFFLAILSFAQTTIEHDKEKGIIIVHLKNDTTDTTFTMPALEVTLEGTYKDSILVDYVGVWSKGFEENKFTPCGNWIPDSLGGVAFIPNRMGIAEDEEVWNFAIKAYPDTVSFFREKAENVTSNLFIKAKGWLIGPGTYDHFGQNRYKIKTTKFKEVRRAMLNECEE